MMSILFCMLLLSFPLKQRAYRYLVNRHRIAPGRSHDHVYCKNDDYQWENFIKNHAGSWAGLQIQTSFEDDGGYQEKPLIAPIKLLCGTSLLPNKIDNSISHINFFVKEEIDLQSSKSIPSSSIVSREVGIYTQKEGSSLPSIVCSTVLLGGPDSTADALTMQFSFAHKRSLRCRVLLSFESSSKTFIPNTSIEVSDAVALDTISISREKRLSEDLSSLPAPSEFVNLNSPLWRKTEIDSDEFKTKLFLRSKSVYKDGSVISTNVDDCDHDSDNSHDLGLIEAYRENLLLENEFFSPEVSISNSYDDKEDEQIPRFIKAYRGGLVIDSPLAISSGENVRLSAYWSLPDQDVIYKATILFSAMNSAGKAKVRGKRGDDLIDQPILDSFSVETFAFIN